MEAERLQPGIAASEAAAILHVVFAQAGPLNAPVCLPLGIGVTQVTRLTALQDLARLRVVDFLVAGDQVEVRLRPAWRTFFEMDLSLGMPTMPRLRQYGAELRDTEARALIDDTLRRFAALQAPAS